MINRGEEEHASRRIICIAVHVWLYHSEVVASPPWNKSFLLYQSLLTRRALGQDPTISKTHRISCICSDSSRNIFLIQKIFRLLMTNWLFYIGMPVLTHGVSAICLDPNLFFWKQIQKIWWCLPVTVIHQQWCFSKLCHIAILCNRI